MCIISVCPKGTPKDTQKVWDFIAEGFSNNRKGSGYMFKRAGEKKITVDKGYFDLQPLLDSIKKRNLQPEDELVIHHRINTHGEVNIENCHPFVVSSKHEEVIASDFITRKPVITHNGVFRNMDLYRKQSVGFSDTYTFARFFLSNQHIMSLFKTDKELFKVALSDVIYNSKLAVMYPDRELELFGNFIEDEGYKHSNSGYFKKTVDVGGSSTRSQMRMPWEVANANADYEERINAMVTRNNGRIIGFGRDHDEDDHIDLFTGMSQGVSKPKNKIEFKLTGDDIILTPKNVSHFYYIDQLDYENNEKGNKYKITNYDPDSFSIIAQRIPPPGETYAAHRAITNERLSKHFYYIPVNDDYKQIYSDFMALKTLGTNYPIGAKTIKSLDKMINKTKSKDALDFVYYDKLADKFTKMSLHLYRDWLMNNHINLKLGNRTFGPIIKALETVE